MGTKFNEIVEITKEFTQDLKAASLSHEIDSLNLKYLGRQGKVNSLFKSLPIKSDPKIGQQINHLKKFIQTKLSEKLEAALSVAGHQVIDVTVPGIPILKGSLHPLTQTIEEIESIFKGLGSELIVLLSFLRIS